MTTNPIAGNQYFSIVQNSTAQFLKESAVSMTTSYLTATNASVDYLTLTGTRAINVVTGFAPIGFSTAGIASVTNLMRVPGVPAATVVTEPNLLHLPPGALVTRVVVTNNGTPVVGGTSFTIGTKNSTLSSALTNATTTNMVTAMLLATVNSTSGGSVGGITAVTELALGTAGQAATISSLAGQVQGAFDNLVAVTVNTSANTSGDLAVQITYINPV